ncbi:DUF6326 family protein [uncultured Hyphomonas sp.]|uniref:DUF6326 family protein n=1 Tax=uncultured Hyphomonas sp. TaxID=225298 RepID=UPI002AAB8082|nr:DUF6326 family protein [uncultured Hyphomonas sp.]
MPKPPLKDSRPSTPVKLSLLWAALMSLYIYNDYFSMYLPGTIEDMAAGQIGPLGAATDGILIGVALTLAIPALMIALSSLLPPVISRWSNVVFGILYTLIEILTFIGSRPFYQLVVAFEILVTVTVIWTALRWPRETA